MNELTIIANQSPGVATLENFDELKAYLEERLEAYRDVVYTEDRVDMAKTDKKTLSKLKKTLDERRKEIKRIYMAPYLDAEAKIKELMATRISTKGSRTLLQNTPAERFGAVSEGH